MGSEMCIRDRVGGDGKTIGKISMANAIAAMARPDRGDEGPRYK